MYWLVLTQHADLGMYFARVFTKSSKHEKVIDCDWIGGYAGSWIEFLYYFQRWL
jgi:hypothetical protein